MPHQRVISCILYNRDNVCTKLSNLNHATSSVKIFALVKLGPVLIAQLSGNVGFLTTDDLTIPQHTIEDYYLEYSILPLVEPKLTS